MLLRCIDFETTGEPTEDDPHAVCEVGYCDIDYREGDPIPEARIADYGLPWAAVTKLYRKMPAGARAVHHISDAELQAAEIETTTAFMRLMGSEVHGTARPDYFVAHNADYEQAFFRGGSIPWVCTYKVALRVWPNEESHKLQALRYSLGLDIDQAVGLPAHRAGPDAYVNAALMARILEESDVDLDTMVRWSKGPALLTTIGFGKHKGERWENLPTDYLRWIIDKSDLDRDAKANAKHHLKQRNAL